MWSLNNLKWKRHIVRTRHARHVTLQLRVARVMSMGITGDVHHHSLLGVLSLFRQRFRFVRNLAAFYDPLSPRPSAIRTHNVRARPGLRIVILNIDIRRHESLPNSIEIGFAVRSARRPIGRKLTWVGNLCRSGWGLTGCRPDGHQQEHGPNNGHKSNDQSSQVPEPRRRLPCCTRSVNEYLLPISAR